VTGKGSTGKDQCEPSLGAWNVRHDTIDPGVGPRNERLLYQSTVRPCDLSSFSMRPDGQQQCVPFAFAAATTKAAEHWSGRFSEIKILQCPKGGLTSLSISLSSSCTQRRRESETTRLLPIRFVPVTGSSTRLISIFAVETHTTLERIRPCAALLPANVASSALISVSNEPRRHFRVLLDRTESP
jgi:hypothetical protein